MSLVIELDMLASAAGLILSALSIFIAFNRTSKDEAIRLEHRITNLEANGFTQKDRECLTETAMQMRTIWKIFESDLPATLKRETTPELDALIEKILQHGIRALTISEQEQLDKHLKIEIKKAQLDEERQDRLFRLKLYQGIANYTKEHSAKSACEK